MLSGLTFQRSAAAPTSIARAMAAASRSGCSNARTEVEPAVIRMASATRHDFDLGAQKYQLTKWFDAIVTGDDTVMHKPHPESYIKVLAALGVSSSDAIVVEDSRNGLLAAVRAGLRCVVTVSSYTAEEDMSEAVLVVSSLGDPGEPARVLANRGAARPGDLVTLADLDVWRTQPLSEKETV